ncbi:polysaccharide deacetylase family protein [Dactylosporangium darangshiense]|uniref:polysaccharide deacetylase family protein n=1 Tax=Dactylosporangium darangshiense TaxID=579108 RepID=UPI0031EB720A
MSVHDVAPATADETARWCADADALGIPVSLLVIPGPWRGMSLTEHGDYAQVLRERAAHGDELVLHGWCHQAGPEGTAVRRAVGRAVARGAAEFAALDEEQAARRLDDAKAVLDRLGLSTTGFTPPGWLASPAAQRALAGAGFRYTTDHLGVKDLRSGRSRRGFALSHRPGGTGERLGSAILRAGASWAARRRRGLVRVALHPDDLHRPALRDDTLRAIEGALRAGARATTYGAVVDAAAS